DVCSSDLSAAPQGRGCWPQGQPTAWGGSGWQPPSNSSRRHGLGGGGAAGTVWGGNPKERTGMRSTIADIAAIRPRSLVHPESWHCQVAQANTVMVVITGSRPLGVATETSDWDETAVFVEEPRHIFSLDGQIDVHKDAVGHDGKVYGVNHRMSAGDYERVSYSLRHYLRLL